MEGTASPTDCQKNPALQVKLQQALDRVDTGVGLQKIRRQFQGVQRVLRMTVWGLRRESKR